MTGATLRITLAVHPWADEEVQVIGMRGPFAVRAELPDGRTGEVPLSWTDYWPRERATSIGGRPVRLDVRACLVLARIVEARMEECRKLASRDREDHKGAGGRHGGVVETRGRVPAPRVLGQAGSSRAGRGGRRTGRRRGR